MPHARFISKEVREVYLNEGPEMSLFMCQIRANFIDSQSPFHRTVSLLASVSVGFRSKETPMDGILPARNWGESKIRKRGWGTGRKETLADKPLDFENLPSPANEAHDWLDQSNIIDMCRS